MKKIYVVLSHTNSLISKIINFITKDKYSHVSISFDRNCNEMYSFGRKYKYFPFYGVFKKEELTKGLFRNKNSIMSVYELSLNEKKYNIIKKNFEEIKNTNKGYNIIGLLLAKFKIKLNRNKYYCSEFLYEVLSNNEVNILSKDKVLFKPEEIVNGDKFKKIYEGKIKDFI